MKLDVFDWTMLGFWISLFFIIILRFVKIYVRKHCGGANE